MQKNGPAAAAAVSPDSTPAVDTPFSEAETPIPTPLPEMSSEGLLDRAAAGASASAVTVKFGGGESGGSAAAKGQADRNQQQTWKNLPQALQSKDKSVCGARISKQTVDCVTLSLVFVFLVAAGGGIFSLIEHPTELQRIADVEKSYAKDKDEILALLQQALAGNLTDTTALDLYRQLQGYAGGLQTGPNATDNWTWVNAVS